MEEQWNVIYVDRISGRELFPITRLLADQHDLCVRWPFSEHRPGSILP
jgi:hypothetical protein